MFPWRQTIVWLRANIATEPLLSLEECYMVPRSMPLSPQFNILLVKKENNSKKNTYLCTQSVRKAATGIHTSIALGRYDLQMDERWWGERPQGGRLSIAEGTPQGAPPDSREQPRMVPRRVCPSTGDGMGVREHGRPLQGRCFRRLRVP